MNFTENAWEIFNQSITDYHKKDDVYSKINNPYPENDIKHLLYLKNWIDTVQWHLEDIIRDENIDPTEALKLKRWIDNSNQNRTNRVEELDQWFLNQFKEISVNENASINTESPAWAMDRLSILALKIYHMQVEVNRNDALEEHVHKCNHKLTILLEQQKDLMRAIEELLADYKSGNKYMRVYKQMKMYNDEDLNPILYFNKKQKNSN